jgi:hypothetical protein
VRFCTNFALLFSIRSAFRCAPVRDLAIRWCSAVRFRREYEIKYGRLHGPTTPYTMERVTLIFAWAKSMSPHFSLNSSLCRKPVDTARRTNGKTPEQGAATSVLLAASPLLEGISGRYFEDCKEAELLKKRPADLTGGYAAYALDTENADRLWDVSQQLVREIGE